MNTSAKDRDSSPLSDLSAAPEPVETNDSPEPSRRQSGRVRRKPDLFVSQTFSASRPKRKRAGKHQDDEDNASDGDGTGAEPQSEDDGSEDVDDEDEEADEEELKAKRRKARKPAADKKKAPKKPKGKPVAKKQKIGNGISTELALRPMVNGQRPQQKPKRVPVRQSELGVEDGLFGKSCRQPPFATRLYAFADSRV